MVVLLNPSTTIGTYGTDGNLWSRSVKPSLPSVKHVGSHPTGPQSYGRIVRMVTCNHDSWNRVYHPWNMWGSIIKGPQSYGRIIRMVQMVTCNHDPWNIWPAIIEGPQSYGRIVQMVSWEHDPWNKSLAFLHGFRKLANEIHWGN